MFNKFGMGFLLKKLAESKLKDVPAEQREKILALIDKNPELLARIAKEVEAKVKAGKTQQEAMMEVMKENETELKKLMA